MAFITRLGQYSEWNLWGFPLDAIHGFSCYSITIDCIESLGVTLSFLLTFARQRFQCRREIQFTILMVQDGGKFTFRKNSRNA